MNQRPTPETDKNTYRKDQANCPTHVVPALICRRLERERDEAREKLRDLERRNHDTNRKLSDALAELEDWRNAAKGAENPHPDEKHCTCVPLLHKQLKDAREAFAIATDQLVQAQGELRQVREENARLREALENCREDSIELLGERDWWKEEPRCGYQERYAQTAKNLQIADALLTP